jgi:glycyl-tRNA synthetase
VGTPFCITVDFESLDDQKVTVRHRDKMSQDRIAVDALPAYLNDKMLNY